MLKSILFALFFTWFVGCCIGLVKKCLGTLPDYVNGESDHDK